MSKIVIIGPAYPLRGGLATFDQRLAKQFNDEGHDCIIYSFSLQYPSFLFPGTTQYSSDPAPEDLKIVTTINSINPLNWIKVGNELKKFRPDIIVVRYWLPFMGPALGTILRKAKKNRHTKIIAITDNILPHEKRAGDVPFTRYFLKSCDAFITMSEKVMLDLQKFEKSKPARQVLHPLYDNFGSPVDRQEARRQLGIPVDSFIILFFGFIRKYKGVDLLLEAMAMLKSVDGRRSADGRLPIRLVIAGEFYEDDKPYMEQIEKLGLKDDLILKTNFIPDNDVKYYFSAADLVIQPYRNATQSGVTPLSYHFEKPMIVTNVGSLPDLVPHEKVGLVSEPDGASLAAAIERYIELGENYFLPHLRSEKQKYSWTALTETVFELANEV
ncbi:MAG TPA: glycosyltransferase [Flavitalea sp.]|nr:glycosyltransferase [Flavitalea sp.]